MKAVLLAAGQGSRLRPLTNLIPKCLIPIDGIPLMTYWFNLFRKYGVNEVLININYFPEKVEEYISKEVPDIKVNFFFEERLLGSLGTLIKNMSFFSGNEDILIFYSDNLTNINLRTILDFHKSHSTLLTMGLFHTNKPCSCGIVELDHAQTIIDFVEKPVNPKSNLANAGVYVTSREIFSFIKPVDKEIHDIGFDLLPYLVNRMKGYVIPEFLMDIGTLENLKEAEKFVQKNPQLFSYMKVSLRPDTS